MSKAKARGEQSYANERLVLDLVPEVLSASGFSNPRTIRHGQMKFVEAEDANGATVKFWLKLGWTGPQNFCAVQFGLFAGEDGGVLPDERFRGFVADRVESVKNAGATHALFVHMGENDVLTNWVALRIDDVVRAYDAQLEQWPTRARNTKSAALWFEDDRKLPDAECISTVLERQIELEELARDCRVSPKEHTSLEEKGRPGVKKVSVEIERRMQQRAFRFKLGNHFGWRCAVSGTSVMEVLEAAHLPGRDWRTDNAVTDGVLLRADLHRLLDRGLAKISNGKFLVEPEAQKDEYLALHGRNVQRMPA